MSKKDKILYSIIGVLVLYAIYTIDFIDVSTTSNSLIISLDSNLSGN